MSLSYLFLLFIAYSVIGWISEVLYCSVLIEHKFVNRGFLQGPLCPIYGFGGLLVIFLLRPFSENALHLFLMAVIVTSTLEYLTSWALEKIFSTKWWDYSDQKFNLHGRVCLLNSVLFGLMSVIAVRFVHPLVLSSIDRIPGDARGIVAGLLGALFAIDIAVTLRTLVDFREKLSALSEFVENVKESIDVRDWFNELDLQGSLERIRERAEIDASGVSRRLYERLEKLVLRSRGVNRLMHAFPALSRNTKHVFGDSASAGKVPAGTRFRYGPYDYFWAFASAGFFGVVLEMIWGLITTGSAGSRSGLVYGMFNPLYGICAVIMVALLSRLEKKRDLAVFAGGMAIGSAFEYLSSLGQELAFNSVSWDYTGTQLSVQGRTNLLSAFIWGVLGLLWVRDAYPALAGLIRKIPVRLGRAAVAVLAVAIALNCAVSGLAVHRWSERSRGIAPGHSLDLFLDERYADEKMARVYPNMRFVE